MENENRESFGIWKMITQSFHLFFINIGYILIFCIVPDIGSGILIYLLFGHVPSMTSEGFGWPTLAGFVLEVCFRAFSSAAVTLRTFDSIQGNKVSLAQYSSVALQKFPAVAAYSLAISILIGLGIIALIFPGIYLMGMFAALIPALVLEGSEPFSRSRELTRGYRWPVAATLIVGLLAFIILNMVFTFLSITAVYMAGPAGLFYDSDFAEYFGILFGSVLVAGLPVIQTVIYVRLREIKEGSATGIEKVFQ